ncbi:hypothetical protein L249_6610 [Ophiocordyceps polyrhachis-furcata BCC 54312]|uniref:Uncharacterized protein n=1 Tax=Ophiocordyceps polyrhachis-furcata BCC 54312 TaxID=1330021 RepID=A0A367LLU0_9HYPO|nr:hypothetical protein L249_6610 [Ophiocordyceps polyrhachis-furcata BCC 54312]
MHLAIWKNLMRYLISIKALGLTLSSACDLKDLKLRVYIDAFFANNLYIRCSIASYVVFIGLSPTIITLSSTEAEFINFTPTGISII